MIRVTVEIFPHGEVRSGMVLGQMFIINRLTNENRPDYGDYDIEIYDRPTQTWSVKSEVLNHNRRGGVMLKPCPFCGSHSVSARMFYTIAKDLQGRLREEFPDYLAVECGACGALGPAYPIGMKNSLGLAERNWNKRVEEAK